MNGSNGFQPAYTLFPEGSDEGARALAGSPHLARLASLDLGGDEPEQLEPLVQEELARTGAVDAYLIDEVGKMELLCPAFVEAVPRLLAGAAPVVLTVAEKGQGLIAQVKARADVHLVTVTEENRDRLPEELERWVRDRLRVP
jgi:nucleoside-triphosphatase